MSEHKIGIPLQSEHRKLDGMAKDDVANATMAKGLHIMDNAIYMPPLQLGEDVV
jgi:hypothetical protein